MRCTTAEAKSRGAAADISLVDAGQDVQVLPLIRDNALWTMGADSMDIDWESAWRQRLHDVPTASMGSGAAASPRRFGSRSFVM